jgi:hypothetical protein
MKNEVDGEEPEPNIVEGAEVEVDADLGMLANCVK